MNQREEVAYYGDYPLAAEAADAERDAFLQCLAEKLLVYALGRGLERYDRPTLAKITARLSATEHRFSELVLGIVSSMPFQMRSTAAPSPAAAK